MYSCFILLPNKRCFGIAFRLYRIMANEQNLIPFGERSESEQREIRSKGGKASGKSRREKKKFRDLFIELLDDTTAEYDGQTMDTRMLIATKAVAFLTDPSKELDAKDYIKVVEFIRDTIGEKPIDKVAVGATEEAKGELAELLEQRKNANRR